MRSMWRLIIGLLVGMLIACNSSDNKVSNSSTNEISNTQVKYESNQSYLVANWTSFQAVLDSLDYSEDLKETFKKYKSLSYKDFMKTHECNEYDVMYLNNALDIVIAVDEAFKSLEHLHKMRARSRDFNHRLRAQNDSTIKAMLADFRDTSSSRSLDVNNDYMEIDFSKWQGNTDGDTIKVEGPDNQSIREQIIKQFPDKIIIYNGIIISK